jgi:hypothetical protein
MKYASTLENDFTVHGQAFDGQIIRTLQMHVGHLSRLG